MKPTRNDLEYALSDAWNGVDASLYQLLGGGVRAEDVDILSTKGSLKLIEKLQTALGRHPELMDALLTAIAEVPDDDADS